MKTTTIYTNGKRDIIKEISEEREIKRLKQKTSVITHNLVLDFYFLSGFIYTK